MILHYYHTITVERSREFWNETTPPPGAIAAGDNTIPVKQASVPGTSPNKETTHLKIRGSQLSNHAECSEDNRNENQDH